MPQAATVTLRAASGRTIDPACPWSYVVANMGHFDAKPNKRGNITTVYFKERSSLAPLSRAGESYREHLPAGVVWSLRGTSGAIPAPVLEES